MQKYAPKQENLGINMYGAFLILLLAFGCWLLALGLLGQPPIF
jgi:hypothetical protein